MTNCEKHYINDPAKAKARHIIKEEIEGTLLKFRKPGELKVLCFPGIDGAEVQEIYDPLGIPRRNITGLEMDTEIYGEIARRLPDIDLRNEELSILVKVHETLPYDIVSLDFTGNITLKLFHEIEQIVDKLDRNNYLFHIAVLAKRERAETIKTLEGSYQYLLEKLERYTPKQRIEEILVDKLGKDEYDSLNNQENTGHVKTFRCLALTSIILECERVGCRKVFKNDLDVSDALVNRFLQRFSAFSTVLKTYPIKAVIIESIQDLELHKLSGPKKIRRYAYISESGSPMIGDIGFFSDYRYVRQASELLLNAFGYGRDTFTVDANNALRLLKDMCRKRERFYGPGLYPTLSDREFLGSSYNSVNVHSKKPEPYALTKEDIIDLLESGCNPAEIHDAFPQISLGQARAYKAHMTMGTYKKD